MSSAWSKHGLGVLQLAGARDSPAGQIVSVPRAHALATKMMFWFLARVSFRAAKIVSCNKKKQD
jgi:hypothetical protein